MKVTRRDALKLGLMGGVGVALPVGMFQLARSGRRSPPVDLFTVPLPIPPVLEPVRSDTNADYYEITQQEGTAEILPGLRTTIWGYNGIFPGPTIDARTGRRIVVRQTNELPVPVTTHLHGGHTPPESDGYPTDLILPPGADDDVFPRAGLGSPDGYSVGYKDYTYPNEQLATTLWYHDHRMDFTGPQVYKGLVGLYVLRDEVEDALPLPRGEKEVPLIITDRLFNDDGSFFYPSIDPSLTGEPGVESGYATEGVQGDTILVNGAPWPFLEVANTRYRFRILNASNARQYELALDPQPPEGDAFVQVGSDGGLLSAPLARDTVRIAQAERFDVVVDFGRYPVGTEVTLRNLLEPDPFRMGRISNVMRFKVVREEIDESTVPAQLAPHEDVPDPARAEVTRRFEFRRTDGLWTINGEGFDPDRIMAEPRLDATEIWELTGTGGHRHPIHVHLVQFRVLSSDGQAPHPSNTGWKDVVLLKGQTERVIARFSGYRGRYVFHCHNLEHEDMAMMANFEVV